MPKRNVFAYKNSSYAGLSGKYFLSGKELHI
jgi:hypothetical protein